jgi:hypothetical protein
MQINWCLKGIPEMPGSFEDADAQSVLSSHGILSKWMLANAAQRSDRANVDAQNALTASALNDHVNNYLKVQKDTPYISLASGCREYRGATLPPLNRPALRTAVYFATSGGKHAGYVFRCWVTTALQPAIELPGLAEEIRDLNLFATFFRYHLEGEIAAKLVVPRRQVQWVLTIGRDRRPADSDWSIAGNSYLWNKDFVGPERVSNVIAELP